MGPSPVRYSHRHHWQNDKTTTAVITDTGLKTLHESRPEIGDKFLPVLAGKGYHCSYLDIL